MCLASRVLSRPQHPLYPALWILPHLACQSCRASRVLIHLPRPSCRAFQVLLRLLRPLCRESRVLHHPPCPLCRAFRVLLYSRSRRADRPAWCPAPRLRCAERCEYYSTPFAHLAEYCKCCPTPRVRCSERYERPCAHSVKRHIYRTAPYVHCRLPSRGLRECFTVPLLLTAPVPSWDPRLAPHHSLDLGATAPSWAPQLAPRSQ